MAVSELSTREDESMSNVLLGLGFAIASASVGAISSSIKGLSQRYSKRKAVCVWVFGFIVEGGESLLDSWALRLVSSNVVLACKGFGVFFSVLMGIVFAGERLQRKQITASIFLVCGPIVIAFASVPQEVDGIWCPVDASPEALIQLADAVIKAMYALCVSLLVAGHVFKLGNTGGAIDYRAVGWVLSASIIHTLQAVHIHSHAWDPLTDFLDFRTWSLPSADRRQISYVVVLGGVAFQSSETMAFRHAGVVAPVHALYIGTLVLDGLLHDMSHGQFSAYSCTQYWILSLGGICCTIGATIAAGIKHGHHPEQPQVKKKAD
eukprot:gnl/MRDRNA2_/MRDRNA2_125974_c0_seq1.p1 gnl/MRDRNA2_/MRDRNA2_125974_c0~~gnl/MRDRNA2_/MRDRNA2_125974_c0_seq1.p1  ORF type:complete len:321 (+),score=31.79 gnl/MRDRNA2_/MRDRNA2_125974_c0_seq1:109-1071(+)